MVSQHSFSSDSSSTSLRSTSTKTTMSTIVLVEPQLANSSKKRSSTTAGLVLDTRGPKRPRGAYSGDIFAGTPLSVPESIRSQSLPFDPVDVYNTLSISAEQESLAQEISLYYHSVDPAAFGLFRQLISENPFLAFFLTKFRIRLLPMPDNTNHLTLTKLSKHHEKARVALEKGFNKEFDEAKADFPVDSEEYKFIDDITGVGSASVAVNFDHLNVKYRAVRDFLIWDNKPAKAANASACPSFLQPDSQWGFAPPEGSDVDPTLVLETRWSESRNPGVPEWVSTNYIVGTAERPIGIQQVAWLDMSYEPLAEGQMPEDKSIRFQLFESVKQPDGNWIVQCTQPPIEIRDKDFRFPAGANPNEVVMTLRINSFQPDRWHRKTNAAQSPDCQITLKKLSDMVAGVFRQVSVEPENPSAPRPRKSFVIPMPEGSGEGAKDPTLWSEGYEENAKRLAEDPESKIVGPKMAELQRYGTLELEAKKLRKVWPPRRSIASLLPCKLEEWSASSRNPDIEVDLNVEGVDRWTEPTPQSDPEMTRRNAHGHIYWDGWWCEVGEDGLPIWVTRWR